MKPTTRTHENLIIFPPSQTFLNELNLLKILCLTISYDCNKSQNSWAISLFIYLFHFTQTLTTLDLGWNNIGNEGVRHLASALQVNTVRIDCTTSDHSSTISISHRHSQRWIFATTTSAMKEHGIWPVHCKGTR